MPLTDLIQIQAGKETTWGTPVTATVKLLELDEFSLEPTVDSEVYADIRASEAPGYNAAVTNIEGKGSFSGRLTYDDIPYWLEMLGGDVTPSGAGPYVRAGNAPVGSTAITPKRMTFYKGDGTDAYRMPGGVLTDLTISGKTGEPLMIKGSLIGKQVTSGATLAGLSDRTMNTAMADHITLYIDAWGGTIGTTTIASTGFGFEMALKTNRSLRHYLGALTPGDFNMKKWLGSTLKLTVEYNTTSKAYLNNLLGASAAQQYQVRIKAANGANLIAQFDFAGTVTESPVIYDDNDGVASFDLTLGGTYNTGLANWFKYSITNNVAVLA